MPSLAPSPNHQIAVELRANGNRNKDEQAESLLLPSHVVVDEVAELAEEEEEREDLSMEGLHFVDDDVVRVSLYPRRCSGGLRPEFWFGAHQW